MRARCRAPPPPDGCIIVSFSPVGGRRGCVAQGSGGWETRGGGAEGLAAEQVALVTLTGGHQAWPG